MMAFFSPLDVGGGAFSEEARELYSIVWSLERLALSDVKEVKPELVAELREINRRLQSASTPEALAIYEHAYMDASGPRDTSIEEHERIANLLDEDLPMAAEAIEAHWRRGLQVILVAIG